MSAHLDPSGLLPVGPDAPLLADPAAGAAAPPRPRRRSITLYIGLAVVGAWLVVAATIPWWSPFDPIKDQNLRQRLRGPTGDHWFGTDSLGRDLFSRVMHGARISLPLAVVAVALSMLIGCAIGAAAGFFGHWVDEALMRITDITLSFPAATVTEAPIVWTPPPDRMAERRRRLLAEGD